MTATEAKEIHGLERRVRDERELIERREEQLAALAVPHGTAFLPNVERIPGNDAGAFVASGPKIVWHTTEGSTVEGAVGAFKANNSWPHFTLNPKTGRLVQHLPMTRAGRSLEHRSGTVETNRAHAIQVELVGFAGESPSWSARTTRGSPSSHGRSSPRVACLARRSRRSPRAGSGSPTRPG